VLDAEPTVASSYWTLLDVLLISPGHHVLGCGVPMRKEVTA
jgi:hypothetical protein